MKVHKMNNLLNIINEHGSDVVETLYQLLEQQLIAGNFVDTTWLDDERSLYNTLPEFR
jgi:hypothetical protein